MALAVTHAFVSALADDPAAIAAGEVAPQSHWNAAHTLAGQASYGQGGTGTNAFTAGQVIFAGATALGGDTGFTYAGAGQATLALGTITTNQKALNITATWNAGGTTFDAPLFINVTATAAAAYSSLFDFQIAGKTQLALIAPGNAAHSGTAADVGLPALVLGNSATTPLSVTNTDGPAFYLYQYVDNIHAPTNYERAMIRYQNINGLNFNGGHNALVIGTQNSNDLSPATNIVFFAADLNACLFGWGFSTDGVSGVGMNAVLSCGGNQMTYTSSFIIGWATGNNIFTGADIDQQMAMFTGGPGLVGWFNLKNFTTMATEEWHFNYSSQFDPNQWAGHGYERGTIGWRQFPNVYTVGTSHGTLDGTPSARDMALAPETGIIHLGLADVAAPVAQTFRAQSVITGTSNTAGVDLTITGSAGTGTGAGGSIVFKTAPTGGSGTTQNTPAEVLRLLGAGNIKFSNAASFSANGSVPTVLGSIGPAGANTTVQKWLTFQDSGGATRYVPCF